LRDCTFAIGNDAKPHSAIFVNKFIKIHIRTFAVGKSHSLRSRSDFLSIPVTCEVGMRNSRRRKNEHGLVRLLCRPESLYFASHDFRLQRKHGYTVPISVDRIGFRSPVLHFALSQDARASTQGNGQRFLLPTSLVF